MICELSRLVVVEERTAKESRGREIRVTPESNNSTWLFYWLPLWLDIYLYFLSKRIICFPKRVKHACIVADKLNIVPVKR